MHKGASSAGNLGKSKMSAKTVLKHGCISVKNVLNAFLKDIMMRESDISNYDFNDGDGDDDDDDDCG